MHSLLLQAQGSQYLTIALWIGVLGVMYFFMIRPQQQKQKDQKNFVNNLKKGDNVVTIGGMHGKILSVEGTTVVVEVDRGVKLIFDKSAISREATTKTESEKAA